MTSILDRIIDNVCFYNSKTYTIEVQEHVKYEWKTLNRGAGYEMVREALEQPYWSEWTTWGTIKDAIRCRKLIQKMNKQWSGSKRFRLK